MNRNMLAVAVAALLVGGVAVAAYNSFDRPESGVITSGSLSAPGNAIDGMALTGDAAPGAIAPLGHTSPLEYADVVSVNEVKQKEARYASVTSVDAVRESYAVSTPRQVCNDVVVQERLPERDGNVGGTVAGALIGGVVGLAFSLVFGAMALVFGFVLLPLMFPLLLLAGIVYLVSRSNHDTAPAPANHSV